jgi:hypothetical protein
VEKLRTLSTAVCDVMAGVLCYRCIASMEAITCIAAAFLSSAGVTVGLYPYRDFVKHFDWKTSRPPEPTYILSRYKGMTQNVAIPMVLAIPFTALMSIFQLCRFFVGVNLAAVLASVGHATVKRAVKVFSNRMSEQTHRGPVYATPWDAVVVGMARKGSWAWLQGSSAVVLTHLIWFAIPLRMLANRSDMKRQRKDLRPGFGRDVWDAWRIHSFCGLLSAPIRNAFRSTLHRTDFTEIRTVSDLITHERALWHEANVVASRMFREAGPAYFLHGTIRCSFMTSLPWALTFATYRAVGAPF